METGMHALPMLALRNVTVRYESTPALADLSFSLHEGDWLMIAGPNGAGKTTLLNAIAGAVKYTGKVLFKDSDVRGFSSTELAQHIGFLAQESLLQYPFTVGEVVRLGRYAYRHASAQAEESILSDALELTGLSELRDRSVLTLSGGEQQRVFLAQLFAQDPQIMILDEPTSHLDLKYQKQIFTLVDEWRKTPGRAVISVVHDLSFVKAFGTHALLLKEGRAVASGPKKDVLTAETLQAAYDMDVAAWMKELLDVWS